MDVLDRLNAKEGRGTLYFAGQGIQQQWQMKWDMLSVHDAVFRSADGAVSGTG